LRSARAARLVDVEAPASIVLLPLVPIVVPEVEPAVLLPAAVLSVLPAVEGAAGVAAVLGVPGPAAAAGALAPAVPGDDGPPEEPVWANAVPVSTTAATAASRDLRAGAVILGSSLKSWAFAGGCRLRQD
jgi:hypothetical protein